MITLSKAINGSLKGVDYPNDKQKLLIDTDGIICQKHYNLSSNNSLENWNEMKAISKLGSIKKPFVVVVLSPPAEVSKNLKFDDWRDIAETYAKDFGFYNNQWRWDTHQHDDSKPEDTRHLHIYANRIDFRGKNTVTEGRIGLRSNRWAEKFCHVRGWKTIAELQNEKKQQMRDALVSALKQSTSFDELQMNISKFGYTFQLSYSSKSDGNRILNGMRIMTISEATAREKREHITNKAVNSGISILPHEVRSKPRLSPLELEQAKQAGLKFLSPQERKHVLSKAEFASKPGFTLSQLSEKGRERITIHTIEALLNKNSLERDSERIRLTQNETHNKDNLSKTNGKNILEIFLEPSYVQSNMQDFLKKKKKNILRK